jgi:peptidyl-prolyl cis-trans isomerase D
VIDGHPPIMLSLFRQRGLSSVLYGAIIIGTIMTFVLEFRPSAGKKTASLSEKCAARVRGRCIGPQDFSSSYRILIPSRSAQQSRKMNLKRVALDGLIERELLDDEAARLGISVTDDEVTDQLYSGFIRVSVPGADPTVAQTILQEMYQSYAQAGLVSRDVATAQFDARDAAIPVDFQDPKTKRFDIKTYERKVRSLSNRSTTEFREEQSRELLAAKMRDVVRDPVRVSSSEAWEEYDRRYSTATVLSIAVKESWASRWAAEGTPAEALAWVKDNEKAYDTTLQERGREDAPKAGHLRQILIKLAYGATADEKAAALAKLSWAASRIKAGEPFAEVARDVSEDSSAVGGGDMGENVDETVKAAVTALRPGETTAGAVQTQFGYHLITKDDPARAAEIEAQVKLHLPRAMMLKARATDAAKRIAKNIAETMRSGKTAEQAIADAISPLHRNARVDLLRVLAVRSAEGDAGLSVSPPSPGDAAKLAVGGTFDGTTDPDRPQTLTSTAFNRGGDPFPGLSPDGTTEIVTFAFSSKAGAVMLEPVRATDAFVVVQLNEQRPATREEFDKNQEAFELQMVQAKRDEALSLYVKRLRDHAKDAIKIDNSYVEESKAGGTGGPDEEEDL